jgi:hypothetical protein
LEGRGGGNTAPAIRRESFIEHYKGWHIPDEYRIFAYPNPPDRMPIKQQLEMYGRMAITHVAADRQAHAIEAR